MRLIAAVLIFVFTPTFALAQVVINEIMYDLEGSDSGREWVEIYNGGAYSVDLSTWKLFEHGSNHKLNHISGPNELAAGGYALIADNTEKFLIDWPSYSGAFFDSSFSLKNTGELLILRDDTLSDVHSVTYSPEWGATGDGYSLQYDGSTWKSSEPTPGAQNSFVSTPQPPDEDMEEPEDSVDIPAAPDTSFASFQTESQIFAEGGNDRTVIVGADSEYRGTALGLKKKPLKNARFLWNFGDGTTKEGEAVLHTYHYPGDYRVSLNVSSGEYSASDVFIVKASEAPIVISFADESRIELSNTSNNEIDVSWWKFKVGKEIFKIPANTVILPMRKLSFVDAVTGLTPEENSSVQLLFPNGSNLFTYVLEDEGTIIESQKIVETSEFENAQSKLKGETTTKILPRIVHENDKTDPTKPVPASATTPTSTLLATPLITDIAGDSSIYKWLLGAVVLISIGVISSLLHLGRRPEKRSVADEFEIIDAGDVTSRP